VHLLRLGRTEDDRRHIGVLGRPRQRQLSRRRIEPLGNLGQLLDLFDLGLALVALELLDRVLEEVLVGREAAVVGDPVVVLARQETRCQGRPDGGAVLELLVQRRVLLLEALAVEGIVLRLLDNGRNQVVLLGNVVGLLDLCGRPLTCAPVYVPTESVHVAQVGQWYLQ
jgi:hypothetical protein